MNAARILNAALKEMCYLAIRDGHYLREFDSELENCEASQWLEKIAKGMTLSYNIDSRGDIWPTMYD